MRLVIALGGNALLRRGEAPDLATQQHNVSAAIVQSVAPLARQHEVVITHGNGPQVGLLALQAAALHGAGITALDVLGAEAQGMIGYLIELALTKALPEREVATLLTLVEVDRNDPAFSVPSKPIGPVYTEDEAKRFAERSGWKMVRDGNLWRRAVASPMPLRVRGVATIRRLLDAGVVVICAGGGGIPVVATPAAGLVGSEAVIDKDLTAALLAEVIGADRLLILTDVPAVWTRWPMTEGTPIHCTTPSTLRRYRFADGSMRPKVEAVCRFVERTGRTAHIGAIEQAGAVLAGDSGTLVRPD